MTVEPATAYHPHLFCVLWRAYHEDPAKVLLTHGYRRGMSPSKSP